MGVQTMGTHVSDQHSHLQSLTRQNSWFSLTLDEVEDQLGDLGKPLGSMNLDELLKNIFSAEANQSTMDIENSSSSPLQRQASLTLIRPFSGKTVDEVWREIQNGQKMRKFEEIRGHERETTLGEVTLEDFLVKAGLFAEASLGSSTSLENAVISKNLPSQLGLSPSPSIDTLSDTPSSGIKRGGSDAFERTLERRLRRKIKNRESAARSRQRKQAYHNELVSKVSRLEEENIMLKKEKEFENMLPCESLESRYQLRRTSSF